MALTGSSRLGPVFARAVAGAVFTYHGYMKLWGGQWEQFHAGVKSFGFPEWFNPDVMAQVAAWGEFAGGICLLIGLLTRFAALINAGTMFVGIWKAHLPADITWDAIKSSFSGPHGYEFPLVLLGTCLCLFFTGAGALSVDSLFRREKPPMVVTTMPAMKP